MNIENYSDETVDYIYGVLNEQEVAEFEEKLKTDPALAEDVKRMKEMMTEIKVGLQLKEMLNDPGYESAMKEAEKAVKEHDNYKRRKYLLSKKFFRNYIIPIAASLLVLLYIGNLVVFFQNPDMAFEKYYKDYTPEYYAQTSVNEAQVLLVHSIDEYNKGNYNAVAQNMRSLMRKGELNVRGQIMLAIYDAWNLEYTKIEKDDTDKEDAIWYLALTSLKLENFQQAQTFLHEIVTQNYRRAGKAARMERKIGKMLKVE